MFSGKKILNLIREGNDTEIDVDKAVFKIILKNGLKNIVVLSLIGVVLILISWQPLLWISLILFLFLSVTNFLRAIVGIAGDIVTLFSQDAHDHFARFASSAFIFIEGVIYSIFAYKAYLDLFVQVT